jgi:hypothetical protein
VLGQEYKKKQLSSGWATFKSFLKGERDRDKDKDMDENGREEARLLRTLSWTVGMNRV